MRFLIISAFFLSSCYPQEWISNWSSNFKAWKDYSITQIASVGVPNSFTKDEQTELLLLFKDLYVATTCSQVQQSIDENPVLVALEKSLNFKRGFLFDVFVNNYSYEESLLQISRTPEETATYSIVSVWKTKAFLEEIQIAVSKVAKCYPEEYL